LATTDIYETSTITAKGRLARGEAKSTKGEFVFYQDDKEVKRIAAELSLRPQTGPEAWVQCDYETPLVADEAASYKLRYELVADSNKQVVQGADDWIVWPMKATLEAVKWKETDQKAPGFKFRVMQNGKQTRWGRPQVYETTGADAKVEYVLEKGYPYTVMAVAPWEIKKIEPDPEKGRKRKAEVFRNFKSVFVAPEEPEDMGELFGDRPEGLDEDGAIRQMVNLDTQKEGQDFNGSELVCVVAAEEDRSLGAGQADKRVGKAGVFVYVKVIFGPTGALEKSKRDTPKTELLAGLDLSGLTAVTDGIEYKGKVELKQSDGTGKFKLSLGKAGGDTCEITIGSTEECKDSKLTFRNWRRIWYELMAPAYMPLEERALKDGTKVHDFPAAARTRLLDIGKLFFTEFEFQACHLFAVNDAPLGTVMPGTFIGLPGRPQVHILTDFSFPLYPTGKSFHSAPATKAPRVVKIKLCDANYFFDPGDPQGSYQSTGNEDPAPVIGAAGFWVPKASDDGTDCLENMAWEAEVDIAACTRLPTLEVAAPIPKAAVADASTRTVTITELLQNKTVTIEFGKLFGLLGNVGTSVATAESAKIDQFLNDVLVPRNLREQGNKVKFQLEGESGNERRDERMTNVDTVLRERFAALATPVACHPGLDFDGNPRSDWLDYATHVDESRCTVLKIAFNLPSGTAGTPGPADFAGAFSDTKCPITIYFDQKIHSGGLGLAQGGENLVVFSLAASDSSIDVMLHEAAHTMGLTGDAPASGLTLAKDFSEQEPTATYRTNGTLGHRYEDHGHSGSHCAFGMSDADKALPHYDKKRYEEPSGSGNFVVKPATGGTCIMFGENDGSGPSGATSHFCPQCRDVLRARDMSSL
jgi:hypothetical protein